MKGGFTKLQGGSKLALTGGMVSNVPTTQVITIVVILILVHVVLASLIWSNVIQFATNDAKIIVGTILSVAAVLLIVYLVFLSISSD